MTDADLVLGRIPAEAAFPGLGRLDVAAARRALDRAGVTADGVVAVVDAAMERAGSRGHGRARRRPARPRTGRVRRRGPAARVR